MAESEESTSDLGFCSVLGAVVMDASSNARMGTIRAVIGADSEAIGSLRDLLPAVVRDYLVHTQRFPQPAGDDGRPIAVNVRLGISDGSMTELIVPPGSPQAALLVEGATVITGTAQPAAAARPAAPAGGPRPFF